MFENIFETVNSGFAQALYEDYLRDPGSVPPDWRALFGNGVQGVRANGRAEGGGAQGGREPGTEGEGPPPGSFCVPAGPPGDPHTGPGAAPDQLAQDRAPDAASDHVGADVDRVLQRVALGRARPVGRAVTVSGHLHLELQDEVRQVRPGHHRQLQPRGLKLSFAHLVGWAIVRAARQFPGVTHAVVERDGAPYRLDPGGVHLGLAVDVERKDGTRGLMVPVIKHADGMDFAAFHAEYERLVAGARGGKLLPDAYQGGTVSLTNPGTLGTVASVPRLMQGQGAIIATGAIRESGGRRLMTITSTYDHRIIQGAVSGEFLRVIDQLLQGEAGFYDAVAAALGVGPVTAERPDGTAERQDGTSAPVALPGPAAVPASPARVASWGTVASPVGYRRGSADRDPAGASYDAGSPYATWQTRAYSLAELSSIFAADPRTNVGTLSGLDLRNRGVSGRLISVTLVGSDGTRTVSGDVFVAAFNAGRSPADAPLRSSLLDLSPIP